MNPAHRDGWPPREDHASLHRTFPGNPPPAHPGAAPSPRTGALPPPSGTADSESLTYHLLTTKSG
ncbi:hypothetical protein KCU78_g23380, partial [Aureobasidium melanogenum]